MMRLAPMDQERWRFFFLTIQNHLLKQNKIYRSFYFCIFVLRVQCPKAQRLMTRRECKFKILPLVRFKSFSAHFAHTMTSILNHLWSEIAFWFAFDLNTFYILHFHITNDSQMESFFISICNLFLLFVYSICWIAQSYR